MKRRELEERFRQSHGGRMPNDQERDQIELQIDDFVEAWRASYPDYIEEYRRKLEGFRRFRALGLVMAADGGTIGSDVVVLFDEAGDAAAEPPESE